MFLSITAALILNAAYCMLRISANSGAFPKPLSAKEEQECLKALAEGSLEARNTLIERNLRLVAHIVKKYYSAVSDQDDLISIGTIGLIKGISTFDGEKSAKLSTYCARCIENEILMYFRAAKKNSWEVSLDDPIDTDKEGNALALMDIISCEDLGLAKVELEDNYQLMHKYISECLDEREKEIIVLRYGLEGSEPFTQREIAVKKGISRSYVSRIEKKALQKLENAFNTNT